MDIGYMNTAVFAGSPPLQWISSSFGFSVGFQINQLGDQSGDDKVHQQVKFTQ